MSELHLVVGAGPVGTATASLLLAAGAHVRVVTRSGSGPEGAERVAADAADAGALSRLADGATAIYNCANPEYHRWAQDWPPVAAALLTAAESSGAVLATTANLYPYGPVDGPMTPDLPLAATYVKARVRAQMWTDALALHRAGRIRATEVRGSDYACAGDQSALGRVAPRVLAGKPVRVLGDPDLPHTWTAPQDMARTLVAVATDERGWGRAWHAVSNPACTQREAITRMAEVAGVAPVAVAPLAPWMLRAAGLFSPVVRELQDTRYQWERPFVMDDTATRQTFGLAPTPFDEVLRATIRPGATGTAAAA